MALRGAAAPSDLALTLLGAVLCVAGSGVFYVMPAYIGDAATLFRLSGAQAGALSGGESLAITAACGLASLMVRRMGRRALAACALVCVLGDVASNFAPDFHWLFGIRIATGLLGEGALYACSYAVLGMARKPDRAFGIALVAAGVAGAASMAARGPLHGLGAGAVLAPIAAAALILPPLLGWLPALGEGAEPVVVGAGPSSSGASRWILASIAIWFAAPGFYWAFADMIGTSNTIPEPQVSQALAIATLAGLAGLAFPVVLVDRYGRMAPILAGTAGVIAAAWISLAARSFVPLAGAFSLFYVSWNLVSVYQLAALSASDRSGRYAGFGAVGQLVGLSVGPAVGGVLIDGCGFSAVPAAIAGFGLAGVACLLVPRLRRGGVVTAGPG